MSPIFSNPVYRYGLLGAVVVGGATLAVTLGPTEAHATQEEAHTVVAAQPADTSANLELLYMAAGLSIVGAAIGIGLGEFRHLSERH